MKSFGDFIFECYRYGFLLFEGKYSDEHAFRKVWNHFITHRKYGQEIRDLINAGKYDDAREAMEKEIDAARQDPKHPLSFEKAKRSSVAGRPHCGVLCCPAVHLYGRQLRLHHAHLHHWLLLRHSGIQLVDACRLCGSVLIWAHGLYGARGLYHGAFLPLFFHLPGAHRNLHRVCNWRPLPDR